jgi:hypothetical protein
MTIDSLWVALKDGHVSIRVMRGCLSVAFGLRFAKRIRRITPVIVAQFFSIY